MTRARPIPAGPVPIVCICGSAHATHDSVVRCLRLAGRIWLRPVPSTKCGAPLIQDGDVVCLCSLAHGHSGSHHEVGRDGASVTWSNRW